MLMFMYFTTLMLMFTYFSGTSKNQEIFRSIGNSASVASKIFNDIFIQGIQCLSSTWESKQKGGQWKFPGGPVVKTPCFQRKGPGFDPW